VLRSGGISCVVKLDVVSYLLCLCYANIWDAATALGGLDITWDQTKTVHRKRRNHYRSKTCSSQLLNVLLFYCNILIFVCTLLYLVFVMCYCGSRRLLFIMHRFFI